MKIILRGKDQGPLSEDLKGRLGSHHSGIIEEHLLGWLPEAECAQTGQLLLCLFLPPTPTADFSDKIEAKINIIGKVSYENKVCMVGNYPTLNHSNILHFILFFFSIPHEKFRKNIYIPWGFPGCSVGKDPVCNAGDTGVMGSVPGLWRSPAAGHRNPPQYSCMENPMDRGAWRTLVPGAAESWTQLKQLKMHTASLGKFLRWHRKFFLPQFK